MDDLSTSLIYGPDDEFVNLFAKISRLSPLVPFWDRAGFISTCLSSSSRSGVCRKPRGTCRAKENFDLAGPDKLTLSQIIEPS